MLLFRKLIFSLFILKLNAFGQEKYSALRGLDGKTFKEDFIRELDFHYDESIEKRIDEPSWKKDYDTEELQMTDIKGDLDLIISSFQGERRTVPAYGRGAFNCSLIKCSNGESCSSKKGCFKDLCKSVTCIEGTKCMKKNGKCCKKTTEQPGNRKQRQLRRRWRKRMLRCDETFTLSRTSGCKSTTDCGKGNICKDGACVYDMCPLMRCPDKTICKDNHCQGDSTNGVVIVDRTNTVCKSTTDCSDGYICKNGACIYDMCPTMLCLPPSICKDNACREDR